MGQRVTGLIFWAMFPHSCSREVVSWLSLVRDPRAARVAAELRGPHRQLLRRGLRDEAQQASGTLIHQ